MTLDEARALLTEAGPGHAGVVYCPGPHHPGVCEDGVITSVNEHWVFVRYSGDTGSKATAAQWLTPLAAGVTRHD